MVVLPAGWSPAWEALWGSIFRAGRPGCPLTHICFYKYSLSNVGGGRMFTRSGKGGLGSKDKKTREEARRKLGGRGAQGWVDSGGEVRGPRHASSFVAAALGSPKLQRAASKTGHWPGAWRHSHFDLSSAGVRTPRVQAFTPRAPPAPLPLGRRRAGSHRVGCGSSVAGPEGRQGDGGRRAGPHSSPGGPRSEPRRSLKLTNGAVPSSAWEPRTGGDKRGSGGRKSPRPRGPAPPLWAEIPALPGEETGTVKMGVRGNEGATRIPSAHPRAGLERLQS